MNYKSLIIFLLITINLILLGFLYFGNRDFKQVNVSLREKSYEIEYLLQKNELLQSCFTIETKSNHHKIKDDIELISIQHDTTTFLSYISQFDRTVIVLYLSNNDCHTCIEEAYKYLEDIVAKNIPAMVIAHFDHFHNFYNHYLSLNSDVPTYWVSKPLQVFNQEVRYNFPFVFVTDTSFVVRRFYIPKSEFPNRNKQYFYSLY
jgi:hypothetical protein